MDAAVLPYDIWREVVDTAASEGIKEAATLALVSRTFFDWVKPFLYKTFVYYTDGQGWPVPMATVDWFETRGLYLRNLMWGEHEKMELLVSILQLCPDLDNLAIWVNVHKTDLSIVRPSLSKLRLRQLSVNVLFLFGTKQFGLVEAQDPMLQRVTHLDVINDEDNLDWDDLTGLQHIPHLTHVGLQYRVNPTVTDGILRHCKHIEVVVVVQPNGAGDWDHNQEADAPPEGPPQDPRLLRPPLRTVEEWKGGAAYGEKDIWRKAEEVVARRRKQGSWLPT